MDLLSKAKEVFGIKRVYNYEPIAAVEKRCEDAYRGNPVWTDETPTINFTKTLCEETARLALLGTSIRFNDDTDRGRYLQETIDAQYYNIRMWVEYAMAFGTVIIKPTGDDYDCVLPNRYYVTETRNNDIWGCIFVTTVQIEDKYYTRFEYHHFEKKQYRFRADEPMDIYVVENKAFVGTSPNAVDKEIALEDSPWSDLADKMPFPDVEKPLFAVIRTPQANNVDDECPFGLPLVASALMEIRDLDIAYDRFAQEIAESQRIILLDADRLTMGGLTKEQQKNRVAAWNYNRATMGLPSCIRGVDGLGEGDFYNEINPTLSTEVRLQGINHILSQIGYKIGYANGYFVFNEASGIQTATGVEANQQRTIQFIKDVRDRVEKALRDLVEALNSFADVYDLAPKGEYEVTFQFGDITYNEEEDRLRWLSYANTGKIPFWYYLVKFEGFTEEDAKALTASTEPIEEPFPMEE